MAVEFICDLCGKRVVEEPLPYGGARKPAGWQVVLFPSPLRYLVFCSAECCSKHNAGESEPKSAEST